MKTVISEFELLEYCKCPLRVAGNTSFPKHEYGSQFTAVLSDLVLKAFNGVPVGLPDVVRPLDGVREFNQLDVKKTKKTVHGAAYAGRIAMAASIKSLLNVCKVLQPVTRYRLKVKNIQVDGEYAVFRRKNDDPLILQLRTDDLQSFPNNGECPPNFVTYVRFLHFLSCQEYQNARILYLHVPTGKMWSNNFSYALAQQFVESAVEAYLGKLQFPSPGSYCTSCHSLACFCLSKAVAA